ncbi:AbrB/MazE/SpoVT family DNA-binding domain-containing protein [Halorussus salilacus]|uniref:phosphate uptake regulator PhoU n=1 Tax=Halorussus salilacus TaxID=2953750 RepID=UPI0020A0B533|nr:phosphate uptake regulator PhoU [Halorussus salilacus]USZ67667.1 AbrB/MazE/SpoVT family DNA-binding domain-containing protein [Halorussus salilacus]
METRKVQVTGGSTFTVSIPKDWATDNGIEAGERLAFYPQDDSLVVTPRDSDEKSEGTLDITDLRGESLTRTVMTMYVSGFDVMVLESGRIDADQRQAIRQATQSLVGLEVIEETGDRVVIQDLLDSSELSVHNAVTRMRLISLSMLEDAVTAICENDDSLAEDVIERDDDVDRLWFMVSRIFRATLRTPKAAEELGIPREVCFDYHSSARQLERIADHAAKMAQHARQLGEIPEEVAESLGGLHADAAEIVNTAMDALLLDDSAEATALANEAREHVREIDQHTRTVDDQIRDLDAQQAQLLGLIVDSLSRSGDYGGNVAETALQKAAPRPE